jgi:Transposase IS116/IS110/IS902 family
MNAVLDELGLTRLVTSMTGLAAIGAAAILAETSDPRRFGTARAVVKHAGLAPREKLPGAFTGRTRLTGRDGPRPGDQIHGRGGHTGPSGRSRRPHFTRPRPSRNLKLCAHKPVMPSPTPKIRLTARLAAKPPQTQDLGRAPNKVVESPRRSVVVVITSL